MYDTLVSLVSLSLQELFYISFGDFQVDYNYDRSSRASTFIGESEKLKYEQEDSLDWEGYEGNESYPYINGKVGKIMNCLTVI